MTASFALSAICTLEISTLGAASSGRWLGGSGVPSRDDMAEEGVAGGGGEELDDGPEGYLNLGLLLPEGLLELLLFVPSAGETGVCKLAGAGGVVLLLLLLGPPGLLRPNLSLYKAADDPKLAFDFGPGATPAGPG